MTDSVRTQILLAMQARFAAVVASSPTPTGPYNPSGDPIGIQFSRVVVGPLTIKDLTKQYSLGIVQGPESPPDYKMYPVLECNWDVYFEARAPHNQGQRDPALMAEDLITAIIRVVQQDPSWGGLAIQSFELGNEVDISSWQDRSINVVQKYRIKYSRGQFDPRVARP